MTDDTKASDLEVVDGVLRRRDGKDHPRLLGDAFRRDEQTGEIRFDGTTTPPRSVLQNSKTLVASGLVLDGNTSVAAEDMSNELRAQPRKPVFESDAMRAAMGLPPPAPTAATPDRSVPVNMLFPDGPKRGDGGVETPRARARRESRTPAFDSDTVRNGGAPTMHKDTLDTRAQAQAEARCPIWDASGQGVKRSA